MKTAFQTLFSLDIETENGLCGFFIRKCRVKCQQKVIKLEESEQAVAMKSD